MFFHTCGPRCSVHNAAEGGAGGGGPQVPRDYLVDLHCHIFIPAIERLVADRPERAAEAAALARGMGPESVDHNNRVMLPSAIPKLNQLNLRLADMNAMGVDLQIISPSPTQYYYWADAHLAETLVREQNEGIAAACAKMPDRLLGLGTVALQHPELAARQLEHAVVDLKLKGVEISTAVNGLDLGNPTLLPFWRKANELECVVFIHPFGSSLGDRVERYYLGNIIGQPLETTIALSDLIFSGRLDQVPRVKIVAAHGGGYLPTYVGRSNHGFEVRPESHRCKHAPAWYLKKIWFDSLVYEPLALRRLIDQVGASQVVVGTDYPFDMGHYTPRALLGAVPGLTAEERRAILSLNALELVGESHRNRVVHLL